MMHFCLFLNLILNNKIYISTYKFVILRYLRITKTGTWDKPLSDKSLQM